MHVQSTINEQTRLENAPIALFSYEDNHQLLALEKSYQDMIDLVRTKFKLDDGSVSLHTSTLDICAGKSVKVDETAYPYLTTVLGQVHIVWSEEPTTTSTPPTLASAAAEADPKGKARATTLDDFIANTPPASSDDAEDEEDEVETVISPNPAGAITEQQPKPQKNLSRASSTQGLTRTASQISSGGPSARPRQPSKKPVPADVKKEPAEKAASVVRRPKIEPGQEKPQPKAEKEQKFRAAARPKSKAPGEMRSEQEPQASQPPASQEKGKPDEDRFKIHISAPDSYGGHGQEFKTRGGHLIKKVLLGACKTFGINPEGFALYRIETTVLEDGTEDEDLHYCDGEYTVAEVGLTDGDRLVIDSLDENDLVEEQSEGSE